MSRAAGRPRATLPLHDRIALVFDFDETLAEDTFGALIRHLDEDPETFKTQWVTPLRDQGWDKQLARSKALIDYSRRVAPITRETFQQVGRTITLFDGVEDMFERVRDAAAAIDDAIEVEFYVVSGGFEEILGASPIADRFAAIYGCALSFRDGDVDFAKKLLSDAEKPRYLQQISQGLSETEGTTGDVQRDVDLDRLHVPFAQMVYVGDGASDMEAFSLMNEFGGIAIALFQDQDSLWQHRDEMRNERQIQNLALADYTADSELTTSLRLAVESIAKRIALRRLGAGARDL